MSRTALAVVGAGILGVPFFLVVLLSGRDLRNESVSPQNGQLTPTLSASTQEKPSAGETSDPSRSPLDGDAPKSDKDQEVVVEEALGAIEVAGSQPWAEKYKDATYGQLVDQYRTLTFSLDALTQEYYQACFDSGRYDVYIVEPDKEGKYSLSFLQDEFLRSTEASYRPASKACSSAATSTPSSCRPRRRSAAPFSLLTSNF